MKIKVNKCLKSKMISSLKSILVIIILISESNLYAQTPTPTPVTEFKAQDSIFLARSNYFVRSRQMDLYDLPSDDPLEEGACFGHAFYMAQASQVRGLGALDIATTLAGQSSTSEDRREDVLGLQDEVNQLRATNFPSMLERNEAIRTLLSNNLLESQIVNIFSSGFPNSAAQNLCNTYSGGGYNDPSFSSAFNTAYEQVIGRIQNRIDQVRNRRKISIVLASVLFNESRGNLTHSTYHAFSIDISRDGTVFFSDPSVGGGVFRDFRAFNRFFRDYLLIPYGRDMASPMYHILGDLIFLESDIESSGSTCPFLSQCACGGSSSSSRTKTNKSSRSGILSANFEKNNYFCNKKLILKNFNYEDLKINIYAYSIFYGYYKIGKNVSLKSGEQIELAIKNGQYYYKDTQVSFIDLDNYGTAPNLDVTDNILFSHAITNAISYKTASLWNESAIIRNYNSSSEIEYNETLDFDGIGGHSNQTIISSFAIGEVQFIELSKWGTKTFDPSKVKKIKFKNVSYDDLTWQGRLRLEGSDHWFNVYRSMPALEFDHVGNGKIKYNNALIQQIDLYDTGGLSTASGNEFDFSWHNSHQINYRPFYIASGPNPVFTLVDFATGRYGSYVADNGIYKHSDHMYIKVDFSMDGETLFIELHGDYKSTGSANKSAIDVNDELNSTSISTLLYPNPTSDILYIKTDYELSVESIKLVDFKGVVYELDVNNNSIDISGLASGTYMVGIPTDKGVTKFYKIVKR